jgi:predicted nucleic acid-binding protein
MPTDLADREVEIVLVMQPLETEPLDDIVVCSIVRGELAYGAAKSQSPAKPAAKQQRFPVMMRRQPSLVVSAQRWKPLGRLLAPMTCRLPRLRWFTG